MPFWLLAGRSAFKVPFAERALPDVTVLPWNAAVLAKIQAHRVVGGRTILATAANEHVAQACAAQLDVFDEVMASSRTTNLKATAKADALVARFCNFGFDSIGDSRADIPVWAQAAGKYSTAVLLPTGVVALDNSQRSSGTLSRWFSAFARAIGLKTFWFSSHRSRRISGLPSTRGKLRRSL